MLYGVMEWKFHTKEISLKSHLQLALEHADSFCNKLNHSS